MKRDRQQRQVFSGESSGSLKQRMPNRNHKATLVTVATIGQVEDYRHIPGGSYPYEPVDIQCQLGSLLHNRQITRRYCGNEMDVAHCSGVQLAIPTATS